MCEGGKGRKKGGEEPSSTPEVLNEYDWEYGVWENEKPFKKEGVKVL